MCRQQNACADDKMHVQTTKCICGQQNACADDKMHVQTTKCMSRRQNACAYNIMHVQTTKCMCGQQNACADDKMNLNEKLKHVLVRIENIVGIRENAGLPAFSSIPTMFSRAFKRLVQIEGICRWQNKFEWNVKPCFGKGRKHFGENAGYQHFSFSHTIFKSLLFQGP